MVKKKVRKTTSIQLRKQIAKLKRAKAKAQKRKEEMEEVRELKREVAKLKGVGTKRAVAKRLGLTGAKTAGKYLWKGSKVVGKFAKNIVEAEAREQERDRKRSMAKRRKKKK